MAGGNRVAPPSAFQLPGRDQLSDLSKAVDSQNALSKFEVVIAPNVSVEAGEFKHLAPRSTGQQVTIPAATGSNFGKRIILFVNGALGACRIRAVTGTIDGAAAYTLVAGYTTLIELVSNGKDGWASVRAQSRRAAGGTQSQSGSATHDDYALGLDITVLSVSADPVFTGFARAGGNFEGDWFVLRAGSASTTVQLSHATGSVAANQLTCPQLETFRLGARESVLIIYSNSAWHVVSRARRVVSNVNSATTAGDLNIVDISTLECGGTVSFQSVTEANIDGFTVKNEGFWFFLYNRDSATSDFITLLENSGNTTTSIRTPNTRGWRMTKNDGVILVYSNNRWRVMAGRDKPYVTPVMSVTWAAQQDNFQRLNTETLSVEARGIQGLRVTLTGDQTLTGVEPDPVEGNGELLWIENIDSVDTLTILHDSTSTAANRFFLPDSLPLKIGPRSSALFRYDGTSDRWRFIGPSPHGRLLARTVLTSGTAATFTHHSQCVTFTVEGVGGGGAAGGTNAAAGSFGTGGGSGTYGKRTFTLGAATSTYTVGAAGTGVSGAAGNAGTASTWLHNSVTVTLPAGSGGTVENGAATSTIRSGGLGGGSATNADNSCEGERGDYGIRPAAATTPTAGGKGGSTPMGVGGSPGVSTAGAGLSNGGAGEGPGAGGGGQSNGTSTAATTGPDGFRGEWIVEEYS